MIGLKESVWWATWYVTSFIRNLITAIALVSLIIFEKTPFIVLAVSIFMYVSSSRLIP